MCVVTSLAARRNPSSGPHPTPPRLLLASRKRAGHAAISQVAPAPQQASFSNVRKIMYCRQQTFEAALGAGLRILHVRFQFGAVSKQMLSQPAATWTELFNLEIFTFAEKTPAPCCHTSLEQHHDAVETAAVLEHGLPRLPLLLPPKATERKQTLRSLTHRKGTSPLLTQLSATRSFSHSLFNPEPTKSNVLEPTHTSSCTIRDPDMQAYG